ncbi:MAG: TonB-dependent receptor, partial [Caulobacteraceae bacterium]|nr:TonB-dependent receptor [Caulobacteraceae bacterium]
LADPSDPAHSNPVATSKNDVDDSDLYYFRPMMLFQRDKFKLLFTYQHQHEWSQGPDQDSYPGGPAPTSFSPSGDPPNAAFGNPGFQGQTNPTFDQAFPSKFKEYQTGDFILQPLTRNIDVGSIETSYDLGFATLTSVTSGFDTISHSVDDSSGFYQASLGFFYEGYPRTLLYSTRAYRDYAFTEEIRLVSKSTGPLTYSLGFFYDQDRNHLHQEDNMEGYTVYEAAQGFGGTGTDLGYVDDREIKFQDLAGFGELTWHVTPKWQVTGGVRVFRQDADIQSTIELPICGSSCDSVAGSSNPLGITVGSEREITKKALMKFNSSYEFAPHFLSYFTFSQGERRGGANGTPTLGPFAENPVFSFYQPDTVDNYELGIKGRVGGRFEFSSAFYWVVWHNPQVQVSTPDGSFPAIVNGKGARSRGIDLEARYKVNDKITLSATYGYVDASLTAPIIVLPTYNPDGSVHTKGDVYGQSGTHLPGTPTHTASIGVDYVTPIQDGLTLDAHTDISYRSGMTTDLTPAVNVNLDGFAMLNASVGVNRDAWRAALFADNITNTRGVLGAENPDEYDVRALNNRLSRPLTIGFRFGYKYR